MSDSAGPSGLSRRRLLAGLATIGGSMSAAGVGTWSLFSDDEQRNIAVKAGTVSLSVDGSTDSTVTVDGITSEGSTERLELINTGTLDANLVVCIEDYHTRDQPGETDSDPIADVKFNGSGAVTVEFKDESVDSVQATVEYGDGETSEQDVSPDGNTKLLKRSSGENGHIVSVSINGTTYERDASMHVSNANGVEDEGEDEEDDEEEDEGEDEEDDEEEDEGEDEEEDEGEDEEEDEEEDEGEDEEEDEEEDEGEDEEEDEDTSSVSLADALEIKIGLGDNDTLQEPLSRRSSLTKLRGKCARADSSLPGGASTDLIVDWKVDGKAEDFAGQTVELDIKVSLQA